MRESGQKERAHPTEVLSATKSLRRNESICRPLKGVSGAINSIYKELSGNRPLLTAKQFFEGMEPGSHEVYLAELATRKAKGEKRAENRANELARRWLESYEAPALDEGVADGLKDFIARKKESMPDAFT